jgi:penicillin-binding protein 1C
VLRAWRTDGSVLPLQPAARSQRFADPKAVALVTSVLSDNSARARAFGLDNALRLPFPVAAKTGTSKGYSDNWTLGFTHERTVAVWAGNFDGTPMVQVSGISGAGPIFKRVMKHAMASVGPAALFDTYGLSSAHICPLSGNLAGASCPAAMTEWFIAGTQPTHGCEMHREVSAQLTPELARQCLALAAAEGRLVDLGVDYYDWARNEGLATQPWLAAVCLGESDPSAGAVARVLHPSTGDEFLMLPDLPLADQAIPVRVRAPPSTGRLEVVIDGAKVVTLVAPYTGRVPVTAGNHRLELKDSSGAVLDSVSYRVRR